MLKDKGKKMFSVKSDNVMYHKLKGFYLNTND